MKKNQVSANCLLLLKVIPRLDTFLIFQLRAGQRLVSMCLLAFKAVGFTMSLEVGSMLISNPSDRSV